jgi:8-oxo-dGTP pyrophosphatase MutT (NUDIX family)
MSSAAPKIEIFDIDRAEIVVAPWQWDFAESRRDEIDRHFAERRRLQPALWNGRVLLLRDYDVRGRVLRGTCFEADYASFLAWRDWDFADRSVFNVFASAALRSSDGAYLLGEMAPSTSSAGLVYFPCGTPDPADFGPGGALDLDGSLRRELKEETGLDIGEFEAQPGWTLLHDRGFLALVRGLTTRQNADELRDRILRHLENDPHPEFSAIRIVRGRGDLDANVPAFVVAYLDMIWRRQEAGEKDAGERQR